MPNGLVIPGGVTWPLLAPDGSAAAPSYSFSNYPTTGMYAAGTNALGFATAGTLRIAVDSAGRVGVGVPLAAMVEMFEVRATYTAGTDDVFGIRSTFTLNTPNNNKHYAGMLGQALIPAANANNLTAWVAGVYPYLSHLGSGTLTAGMGVNAIVRLGNAAIATEIDGYATDVSIADTSQITTLYHLKVNPAVVGGTASIGTEYGLYIGSLTAPIAANRYAIYTAGSTNKIHFGGATDVDGSITFNSAAQVLASSSALAVPGLAFAAAPTTGFSWTSDYLTFVRAGVAQFVFSTAGITLKASSKFIWSASSNPATTADVAMARLGAGSLGLGDTPSATPVAYTLTIGEASRPGTDTNVGGASGTIRSGLGTGTGTRSNLIFQTPVVAASGSTTQTYATRLTVTGDDLLVSPLNGTGPGGNSEWLIRNSSGAGITSLSGGVGLDSLGFNCASTAIAALSGSAFYVGSTILLGWASSTNPTGFSPDAAFARLAAASVRQGLAPSATPIAQTFTIGEASRPGTDLNKAGANGTIRSGLGTGNAAGSSLIFQVPSPIGSSTIAQTYTQVMSLSALGATFDIPDQGFRINGQVSGAGAGAGTITNAPAAGNPTFWLPINVGGTVYFFPGW